MSIRTAHRHGAPARPGHSFTPRALPVCMLALVAAACSGDDDDDDDAFVVRNTALAASSGNVEFLGDDDWLAFLVSESGQGAMGTDFNQDSDTSDSIAVRVDTDNNVTTVLDIAAEQLAFARRTLLMLVSEAADGRDWNGDMDTNDRVLLYIQPSQSTATFLDTAASNSELVTVGGTIIYGSATAPTGDMETNLRVSFVDTTGGVPTVPAPITTASDPNTDGVSFRVTGSDDDIVFLRADETVDGDLNGDSDATDTDIFAVLSVANSQSIEVIRTGLPIAPLSTPTAVPVTGGGEHLVAFLVDEASQGASLNNPSDFDMNWAAPNCSSADTDTVDFVLHWFQMTDLSMGTSVVNTGLIGDAGGTAFAHRQQFVGVVMPENQQGSGTCNLNGDGDDSDNVFRWVDASNPAAAPLPVTTTSRLIAVDTSVPGGSGGVVRLDDSWVILVDEASDARDYDGNVGTNLDLILAHNPTNGSQAWNAQHGSGTTSAIGVSWMSEDPDSAARFFAALTEASVVNDINGDGDQADSVPTIAEIVVDNRLQFPGVQFASNALNAGITVEQNIGFHRVSEASQGGQDLNGDGDATDMILQRFSLTDEFPTTNVATLNTVSRSAVTTGGGQAEFAVFLSEEFELGADLNGDGDTGDFVVRYFELP